ncbi:hypothetical protein [Ornithinimicrobium sp. W1665]|uniref:hypothetical protein n=1 Tax=Ornithinimicrobium sp. W1665 TaxID=3416666 RepID=UPI003CF3802E
MGDSTPNTYEQDGGQGGHRPVGYAEQKVLYRNGLSGLEDDRVVTTTSGLNSVPHVGKVIGRSTAVALL